MDFSNYIFRCHYQGNLVSVPKPLTNRQSETLNAYRERVNLGLKPLTQKQKEEWCSLEAKETDSKKFQITDSAKGLCSDIVFFEKYGRNHTLKNKYFDKGLLVEKDARDLISDVLGIRLISDEETKSNDWVRGKRDIKHDEIIIDIKSCYEFETFNKHITESNDEYYFRQLDSYMDLWGLKHSLLSYSLVDTPFKLIEDELRRQNWNFDTITLDGDVKDDKIEMVVDLIQRHIYTREGVENFCNQSSSIHIDWFNDFVEIPKSERVHLVNHSFDKVRIEQRNECLKLCREYMNTLRPINNLTINSQQQLLLK